ncbi:hypothetical protein EVAR_30544_1 [Eumeta japonica]|uniref:Uncharacterized protein n=1 Tax=Eumeta variegata TaxID=151549 RepID=A0A4C1VMZ1_EUMVA|nr:hypothetical protein EVAR_30544_1 [Eumeta japonica]
MNVFKGGPEFRECRNAIFRHRTEATLCEVQSAVYPVRSVLKSITLAECRLDAIDDLRHRSGAVQSTNNVRHIVVYIFSTASSGRSLFTLFRRSVPDADKASRREPARGSLGSPLIVSAALSRSFSIDVPLILQRCGGLIENAPTTPPRGALGDDNLLIMLSQKSLVERCLFF